MSGYFLPTADQPDNFTYPLLFHRIVDLELTNWYPWLILDGEDLLERHLGIASWYPDRNLVPFARRMDRDDVACWDLDAGEGRVSVIDDFDAPGFEQIGSVDSFEQWLRQAFAVMVEWED